MFSRPIPEFLSDSPAGARAGLSRNSRLEETLVVAHAALDAVADAVVVVDTTNWRIDNANAPARVLFELGGATVHTTHFDLIRLRLRSPDGTVPTIGQVLQFTRHGSEFRFVRELRDVMPVELRGTRVQLEKREVLVIVVRDLGERVRAASELRAASSRCGITFSQAATGLAHVTLDLTWKNVNPWLVAITGYDEAELLRMSVIQITHPDDVPNEAIAYQQLLLGELPHFTREKRYIRKNGESIWVSVTTSLARNESGRPLYFIGMVEDISTRKHAEERIHHLASHDVMTGLPNRHGLQDYLERTLQAARENCLHVAVMFVDMDKLKQINDTLGHEQGDFAIKQFARQLQQQVRSVDMVARIGGDEFVVVLASVTSRSDITLILERTLLTLEEARPTSPSSNVPSCSIGISVFPADGTDARTLIRHADQAMYRAKQDGGARYAFFSKAPTDVPSEPALQTHFRSKT